MAVQGMNHFTILTDDVPGTVAFYAEFLGLTAGDRPPFTFPGAWLYGGGTPILHVIGGRAREAVRAGAAVKLGCDHTNYPAHVVIAADTLASLAGDLK